MKKSNLPALVACALAFFGATSTAQAASISNGVKCAKVGAVTSVSAKGVSKAYICKVNPTLPGALIPTWTLKTCISYWAQAQQSQQSINDQRSLINVMTEPDKTNYAKQLDASQASLNKVLDSITANHCRRGL
jgi:parvulin-like peptidyl-prolyl isomerase